MRKLFNNADNSTISAIHNIELSEYDRRKTRECLPLPVSIPTFGHLRMETMEIAECVEMNEDELPSDTDKPPAEKKIKINDVIEVKKSDNFNPIPVEEKMEFVLQRNMHRAPLSSDVDRMQSSSISMKKVNEVSLKNYIFARISLRNIMKHLLENEHCLFKMKNSCNFSATRFTQAASVIVGLTF